MSDRDERAARLAAQLRANLRRRKDRARAEADSPAPRPTAADGNDDPA
ncbi:hypothetical protein J2Y58_001867 [Sphingomonas sp. BE138]|nr:hypothetical protein [Sphingomonas sp. BE138]MDR6788509.1 hypothetical protein [Sphingomonas sp. BE138]